MEHPGLNITDIPHQALETSLPLCLDTPRPTFPLLLSRSAPGLEPAALGQAKAWSGMAPAGLACLKSREEPGLAETCWCLTHTHTDRAWQKSLPHIPTESEPAPRFWAANPFSSLPGGSTVGTPQPIPTLAPPAPLLRAHGPPTSPGQGSVPK